MFKNCLRKVYTCLKYAVLQTCARHRSYLRELHILHLLSGVLIWISYPPQMGMRGKCEFPKMKHILDTGNIIFLTTFKTGSSDSVTHTRSGGKTMSEMTRSFAKQCLYNFHYETEPQQCAHTCYSLFWGGPRSLSILPRKGLRKGVLSLYFFLKLSYRCF